MKALLLSLMCIVFTFGLESCHVSSHPCSLSRETLNYLHTMDSVVKLPLRIKRQREWLERNYREPSLVTANRETYRCIYNSSFVSLLFQSKNKAILINELEYAFLEKDRPKPKAEEVAAVAVLSLIMPGRHYPANRRDSKPIYFKMTNGETVTILTDLEQSKVQRIVDVVNGLVRKGGRGKIEG